jgi:hypothetical protein
MEMSLEKNVSNNVKSSTHCQHAIDNGSNNVSRNGGNIFNVLFSGVLFIFYTIFTKQKKK